MHKLRCLKNYKCKPVNRIFISKGAGRARPLDISTIEDRAVQSLFKLVIEPLIEVNADKHSFGFRPYRSTHQALAALREVLKSNKNAEKLCIIDADIEGFLDNISHKWILANLPIPSKFLYVLQG